MKTRNKTFRMRVTDAEYKALKALAAGHGLPMSQYIAMYIRKEAKKQGIPV